MLHIRREWRNTKGDEGVSNSLEIISELKKFRWVQRFQGGLAMWQKSVLRGFGDAFVCYKKTKLSESDLAYH